MFQVKKIKPTAKNEMKGKKDTINKYFMVSSFKPCYVIQAKMLLILRNTLDVEQYKHSKELDTFEMEAIS